ncbi:MAG: hypothetical protein QM479_09530 [Pseudomonadota bacterium]
MDILSGGHSEQQAQQLFLNAAMANRHGLSPFQGGYDQEVDR